MVVPKPVPPGLVPGGLCSSGSADRSDADRPARESAADRGDAGQPSLPPCSESARARWWSSDPCERAGQQQDRCESEVPCPHVCTRRAIVERNVALTRRGRRAYRSRHSDESLMWWFMPRTGHSRDARRRVGALVGIWALLAQIALPPLHAWAAGRDTEPPAARASAGDETAPQLRAKARRVPVHDASDCPVCRSLVQVRHFLAPPAPVPAATPWPQVRDVNVSVSVASVTIGRLASPRGPPRRA